MYNNGTKNSQVEEDYGMETSVAEAFTKAQNILKYQPSQLANDFGKTLKEQDVLCYIAIIYHIDSQYYDDYELAPMLPKCEITDAQWNQIVEDAENRRNINHLNALVQVIILHLMTLKCTI